jgi:hypothetical protein
VLNTDWTVSRCVPQYAAIAVTRPAVAFAFLVTTVQEV